MWTQKRIISSYWNYFPAPSSAYPSISMDGFRGHPIINSLPDVLLAKNAGMNVCFFSSLFSAAVLDIPTLKADLDQVMAAALSAGNIRSYFVIDEPAASQFAEAARLCRYIEQKSPNTLPYINVWPIYASETQLAVEYSTINQNTLDFPAELNRTQGRERKIYVYLEYLKRYLSIVKPQVLSYDHYHFFDVGNGDEFFLNLAIIAKEAKKAKIPFFNTIQSAKDSPLWTLPSDAQLRYQIFISLAYGCRGIIYYTYWGTASTGSLYQSGVRTPLVDSVQVLNKELNSLSACLISYEHISTYQIGTIPVGGNQFLGERIPFKIETEDSITVGLFGQATNVQAILIANNSYTKSAVCRITSRLLIWRINKKTGEWLKPMPRKGQETEIQVVLSPGDGELLVFAIWGG